MTDWSQLLPEPKPLEPTTAPAESTRIPKPKPAMPVPSRGDKTRARIARGLRKAYGLSPDFKASDEEVMQAGFDIQSKTIPNLTRGEFETAARKLYDADDTSSPTVAPEPAEFAQPIGEALSEGASTVGKKIVEAGKALVHEVKEDVVSLPKAATILSQPGALARIYAELKTLPEDSPVREEAESSLDALARSGAVTASTIAAVFTGGASKALPWLLRAAAEGAAAGGTYGATKAAVKGESLPEVGREALGGAVTGAVAGPVIGAVGRGIGAVAGKIKGRAVPAPEVAPSPSLVAEPEPIPAPAEGAPAVDETTLVKRFITAIEEAKPAQKGYAKTVSEVRSQRIKQAMAIQAEGRGQAGSRIARAKLRGEIQPEERWTGVTEQFGQPEVDALFNMVNRANISPFERVRASVALEKLLDPEGTKIPTRGELKLLEEVYGEDFSKAITKVQGPWAVGKEWLLKGVSTPRAIMSSLDFSAIGRQGIMMVSRPEYWRAIGPSVRSAFSKRYYEGIIESIKARPSYQMMRDAGLAIGTREEQFPQSFAESLPIIRAGVGGSQRSYNAFLYKVRADVFDNVRRNAEAAGVDVGHRFSKSLAEWVNTFTGRGNLGVFEDSAKVLNQTLFSPRLLASRIRTLSLPFEAGRYDPVVYREAMKTMLASGAALGGLLAVAGLGGKKAGISVNPDPRSADFAKIRVGATRLDLLGGHQQLLKYLAQMTSGETVSTTTGRVSKLGDTSKRNGRSRWDITLSFVEGKLQPVASFVVMMLKGKDFLGNPIDLPKEVVSRLVPLLLSDTYEAIETYGPAGAAVAVPGVMGIGIQTYQPSSSFIFEGVKLSVEGDAGEQFAKDMREAEARAVQKVADDPKFQSWTPEQAEKATAKAVAKERVAVKARWRAANVAAIEAAKVSKSEKPVKLSAPKPVAEPMSDAAHRERRMQRQEQRRDQNQ